MTETTDDIRAVLEEIRDIEREHLDEYRRAAERSISLQESALSRQEQVSKLYRRVVAVSLVLVVGLTVFALYLAFAFLWR